MARRAAQSLAGNVLAMADSSEIANRFLKHGFRAENPNVSSESGSSDRRLLKWLESRRNKPTIFGNCAESPHRWSPLAVAGREPTSLIIVDNNSCSNEMM